MTARVLPRTHDLPRALYTAAQVREFDRLAIERFGTPSDTLMERAGSAAYTELRRRWPNARRIGVLVGTGNNGGDGFVIARLARADGLDVQVMQLGDRARLRGDAAGAASHWSATGGVWDDFERLPHDLDVIVDALLGTGLERDVRGRFAEVIAAVNSHAAPCLAIDLPSGLHADSGVILGNAVRAAATVTFIGLKQGLFTADGPDCTGEIVFDGLEVPAAVYASTVPAARRIDWGKLADLLPRRPRSAHKGHFGHVLVVGGNNGFGGAALMAATAALRTGAGLVSLATKPAHIAAALAVRPEVMAHAVGVPEQLAALLGRASVVAIGPGLGRDDWALAMFGAINEAARPLIVDADALHLLAASPSRRDDWVLTPHPGEAAALLGSCTADIRLQRFDAAAALQRRYGGIAVLKGAGSLVAGPAPTPMALCSGGNPGMASGGMGDVLTGIIAGLLAQGLEARDAAECGVALHAAAGDQAAADGQRGLVAGDLIDQLRSLLNP